MLYRCLFSRIASLFSFKFSDRCLSGHAPALAPRRERCPLETSKLPNSAGDRRFESISLQQRVCKLSVPLALSGSRHAVATWRCSSPTPRYRGRLPVVTDIARLPQAPLLRHPYRRRLSRSRLHLNPGPILAVRFCPLHSRTPAIVTAAWWTRASVRRTAPSRRSGPRLNIRSLAQGPAPIGNAA